MVLKPMMLVWLGILFALILLMAAILMLRHSKRERHGMLGSEILVALLHHGWSLEKGRVTVLSNVELGMRITRTSWTTGDPASEVIRFMRDDEAGQAQNVYEIHCPRGGQPHTEQEGEIMTHLRQWGFV